MRRRLRNVSVSIVLSLLVFMSAPFYLVMAQSPDTYNVSLEAIGYRDVVLYGPQASSSFYFSLPASWAITDGTYLTLEIEYQALLSSGEEDYPPALLTVRFNNQTVTTEELLFPATRTLTIDLPAAYFRPSEDSSLNVLQVIFEDYSPCELSTFTSLRIRSTSTVHFAYEGRPLNIDLAFLPKPLYQARSFEPQMVRVVLPDDFDAVDVRAATIVAARLGQLTFHNLPITVTLASDLLDSLPLSEDMIVIGALEENPVIDQLTLPISLAERQLALRSYMPGGVGPGDLLTYTLFVENTARTARSLTVEDRFSPDASFNTCGAADCSLVNPGVIRWDVGTLAAGEVFSTEVGLAVTSVVSPGTMLRHTATLLDAENGDILNVDTLGTLIMEEGGGEAVVSPQFKTPQFFVWDGQAVPDDAGVIQELVSPWDPVSAVIVVTGLSDEGLLKAAHGLNPENHFPGLSGTTAIVEDMHSLSPSGDRLPSDVTFGSLGYQNVELSLLNFDAIEYLIELPSGETLGEDSYVVFHVSHAAMTSLIGGGAKISLNGMPVGSFLLGPENLMDAWVRIPLNNAAIRPGTNSIRVETNVETLDRCLVTRNDPYWLAIYKDSFLHLDFKKSRSAFSLQGLPHPLNWPGSLENVLFALSDAPDLGEVEGVLRVASLLGSGTNSKDLLPQVTFGGTWEDVTSLSDLHILAVGLPTDNLALQEANGYLPQPFVPGSNDIYQSIDSPVYGILPGTDLGLVQEILSPWDATGQHAFLALTGTTEQGVVWALSALSQSRERLQGNLAIAREDEIYSTDTYPIEFEQVFDVTSSMTGTSPETSATDISPTLTPPISSEQVESPVPTDMESEEVLPSSPTRPWWLLVLFFVSLLGVGVSVFLTLRKRSA